MHKDIYIYLFKHIHTYIYIYTYKCLYIHIYIYSGSPRPNKVAGLAGMIHGSQGFSILPMTKAVWSIFGLPGIYIWIFPKIGENHPKWMVKILEKPMNKMDDLGVPLFLETPK